MRNETQQSAPVHDLSVVLRLGAFDLAGTRRHRSARLTQPTQLRQRCRRGSRKSRSLCLRFDVDSRDLLSVDLIVRAQIQQHDLLFSDLEQQRQPVAVREADRLHAGQLAAERVELELGLEWISAEIVQ